MCSETYGPQVRVEYGSYLQPESRLVLSRYRKAAPTWCSVTVIAKRSTLPRERASTRSARTWGGFPKDYFRDDRDALHLIGPASHEKPRPCRRDHRKYLVSV